MAFCSNCGKELMSGSKFCHECGAPVEGHLAGEYRSRKQVYVGKVRKCPSCGEELPSMTAVCPACGHEVNSTQVHPALQKFIDELEICDQSIADEESINTTNSKNKVEGWHSWNTVAKILWVIVNCLTICVPIVVYYFFRSQRSRKSAPSIRRKANLIENFQIPSERQAIIEFLYFIRDKVSALGAQKTTSDIVYWVKLWEVKSNQIYKKAQAAMPDDITVSGLYHEISASIQRTKKASRRKSFFFFAIALVYIAIVVAAEVLGINQISRIANIPEASRFLLIIWGFCAVLLLLFFIWAVQKIPKNLKKTIIVMISVAALVLSVRSCQNTVTEFTTQIGKKVSDNNMVLSDVDMNELTKEASIEIRSLEYDKGVIDKAEGELFDIARNYKFRLEITFVDSNEHTIRNSKIDEHGAVKYSIDNTNGVIEFVTEKCAERGAKLYKIDNGFINNTIEFTIQIPTTDSSAIMDDLQQEIMTSMTQFGYSGYKIEFQTMENYMGALLRSIEVESDGSVYYLEQVSEYNQPMIDENIAKAITKCRESKCSMVVTLLNNDREILWKSFVDADGNPINVDVYHYSMEAKSFCEDNGATINNIVFYNHEISFKIYTNSRRRDRIDKIEEGLVTGYQTYSDLKEMSMTFWDKEYPEERDKVYKMDLKLEDHLNKIKEVERKHKIRETKIDSYGAISHSIDNST